MLAKLASIGLIVLGVSSSACSGEETEYTKEEIYSFVAQVQGALGSKADQSRCRLPEQAIVPIGVKEAVSQIVLENIVDWHLGFSQNSVVVLAKVEGRKYSINIRVRDDSCYQFEAYELVN